MADGLTTAINGLDKIQAAKMKAARQRTREVNDIAVNVAKSEGWNTPNGETSPGSSRDRGV